MSSKEVLKLQHDFQQSIHAPLVMNGKVWRREKHAGSTPNSSPSIFHYVYFNEQVATEYL